MDIKKRIDLIKEVGEEVITEEDLKKLLETKKHPLAYDGFEPSGRIHIAQGILRAINVNKMLDSGCKFTMWVADWHGWANNKMGGDLEKIKVVGKYMIEVWKACGMSTDKVDFQWVSDIIDDTEYWKTVMQVARKSTLKRMLRCVQIMGRKESDVLQASQILYPSMQCADIFYLKADICQLGMDQRKVNVLARELAPSLGFTKPVAVHHHMLMGLGQPIKSEGNAIEKAIDRKMSKSKPETAIFMTDSEKEIETKINNAYCPSKITKDNPILDYCKYLIFEKFDELKIERPKKYGGNLVFINYNDLVNSFEKGDLHPMDLKNAVSYNVNKLVDPVRKYFDKNSKAKQLLKQVKSFEVSR